MKFYFWCIGAIISIAFSLFFCGLLLTSFFSNYSSLADSISHFRLYIIIVLVVLALLSFWLKLFSFGLLNTVASIIGFLTILNVSYNWQELRQGEYKTDIKLLQLNLFYRNYGPIRVVQLIDELRPDIITFQELSKKNNIIIRQIRKDYPYRLLCYSSGIRSVAVLSKYPPVSRKSQRCYKSKGLTWLQIKVDGRPVSIASLHLKWPYPYNQSEHISQLQKHLEEIPRPVIIAGDFNATPWSYSVKRVERATDTHVVGGIRLTYKVDLYKWGFGQKLPVRIKFRMPIDHILVSDDFLVHKISKERYVGSDHAPIFAEISIMK